MITSIPGRPTGEGINLARRALIGLALLGMATAACAVSVPGGQPSAAPGGEPSLAPNQPDTTPTPEPTSLPTPLPSPELARLTEPGCCTQPFWSPDGTQVRFIDRPAPDLPTGVYGVGLEGGQPQLVETRLGIFSPDGRLRAFPEGDETYVQNLESGETWLIPNEGRPPIFSPDSTHVAWSEQTGSGPLERRPTTIHTAAIDGSDPREVFTLYDGGLAGWLGGDRLLLIGKRDWTESERALFTLDLDDGATLELARGVRLRGGTISPGGEWIAYLVIFEEDDPESNGLWVVRADGYGRRKLDLYGGFQWRDDAHLLVIPMELNAPSHELWQVEARTGDATRLTDPALTPFKVAMGDWAVAPGGEHIVFVSAEDHAIWLMSLPPLE
jgi:hypothetical protein